MSQNYTNISITDKVANSLEPLKERDLTGVTLSAGEDFPQEINSDMIGRVCLRTDLKSLYYLSNTNPITWTLMLNFSQPLASLSYVQSNYQPLNANLTALSQLAITADSIPYFNSATTMSTLPINSFLRNLLNVSNASQTRSLLGLGALATVDSITSSNVNTYINNASLPVSKFNFTPITAGEGYTIGDVKESYNATAESDYLELNQDYTIGDGSSGATYTGSDYNALYVKIWGLPNVTYYAQGSSTPTTKGSSASADWNAHKRMTLPSGTNYLNSNCHFRIKYK